MRYEIHLTNPKGMIVGTRPVGTWRDHAAEVYAGVRERVQATNTREIHRVIIG